MQAQFCSLAFCSRSRSGSNIWKRRRTHTDTDTDTQSLESEWRITISAVWRWYIGAVAGWRCRNIHFMFILCAFKCVCTWTLCLDDCITRNNKEKKKHRNENNENPKAFSDSPFVQKQIFFFIFIWKYYSMHWAGYTRQWRTNILLVAVCPQARPARVMSWIEVMSPAAAAPLNTYTYRLIYSAARYRTIRFFCNLNTWSEIDGGRGSREKYFGVAIRKFVCAVRHTVNVCAALGTRKVVSDFWCRIGIVSFPIGFFFLGRFTTLFGDRVDT